VVDVLSVYGTESVTSEKYRLWWFHSTRKARLDDERRMRKIERAIVALQKLQDRLLGPRTRLRTREQIQAEVDKIIEEVGTEDWLRVLIVERWSENYKQATPGRPGPNTKYVKELTRRHNLEWSLDPEALARAQREDGVFPLITNARDRTAIEVLRAYKRQPVIEKRFAQVKTDYRVGPVFLKSVHRIQAILCLYFFAMVVQSLIERELRNAMTADGLESLPLYPEQRDCRRPTARRVIDVFEPIQRHSLKPPSGTVSFITQLSPVQQKIVALLSLPEGAYTA
jgi:transposase